MPSAKVKMRIESQAVANLVKRLAALDRKVARKALKAGVNEVTKNVLWDAKSLVPKRTGLLRKSLGRKVKSYRGGAIIVGIIGPRRGFRTVYNGVPINPVKYAHLVEYGRREVRVKKKKVLAGSGVPLTKQVQQGPFRSVIFGVKVRSVPPRPFLRPAWEQNRTRAVDVIVRHLRLEIIRFYGRARQKRADGSVR